MVDEQLLRQAAATLRADAVGGDVVAALQRAGLPCLLLRGPVMARALYDRHEVRPYRDVDLLVPQEAVQAAGVVLERLGFRSVAAGARPHEVHTDHAETWVRPEPAGVVDLHRGLVGLEADRAWDVLARDAVGTDLAGVDVLAPSPVGVALIVALHAAQHGADHPPALRDLDHAVDRFGEDVWCAAAERAAEGGGLSGYELGLRQTSRGAALADRLRLEVGPTTTIQRLRAGAAPRGALTFELLARTTPRRRPLVLVRKVVPSTAVMRARSPLARAGRTGLLLAHLTRWTRAVGTAVPAWRAWRRERDAG